MTLKQLLKNRIRGHTRAGFSFFSLLKQKQDHSLSGFHIWTKERTVFDRELCFLGSGATRVKMQTTNRRIEKQTPNHEQTSDSEQQTLAPSDDEDDLHSRIVWLKPAK